MSNALIISSGKGGTGKTTTAVNLGVSMAQQGLEVLLVDAAMPTPDVGLHLGLPFKLRTLNHVLSGESDVTDAIFIHESGLEVLPASIHLGTFTDFDPAELAAVLAEVKDYYDWVLIDCAAGLGREVVKSIEAADKMLVVTNPELPSVADSFKAIQVGEEVKTEHMGTIITRSGRFSEELNNNEVQAVMGDASEVVTRIPEDRNVPRAIATSEPIVLKYPYSPAAMGYKMLASRITGRKFVDDRTVWDRVKCAVRGY